MPVPFLWCGGSRLGCAVVPVMGALFQSILAMQLLIHVNMLFIVGKHSAATESMYLSGYLLIKSEQVIQG